MVQRSLGINVTWVHSLTRKLQLRLVCSLPWHFHLMCIIWVLGKNLFSLPVLFFCIYLFLISVLLLLTLVTGIVFMLFIYLFINTVWLPNSFANIGNVVANILQNIFLFTEEKRGKESK